MLYYGQCVAQCGKRSQASQDHTVRNNVHCSSRARVQTRKMFWINSRRTTVKVPFSSSEEGIWQSTQGWCREQQLVAARCLSGEIHIYSKLKQKKSRRGWQCVCIHICIYIYAYIIYINTLYWSVCVHIYICVYIYTHMPRWVGTRGVFAVNTLCSAAVVSGQP